MTDQPMTPQDFAAKVAYEGGVLEAISYGLEPEDAPEGELRDLWQTATDMWKTLSPVVDRIVDLLHECR